MTDPSGKVIHCWSGPRCCSTALMYSFAQRADTKVIDEPLYASYLHRTGIIHPGQEEILATYDTDGDRVMERDVYAADSTTKAKPILYVKHIGKHKVGVRNSGFDRDTHVLLVREPAAVLRSWAKVQEPTMQELGYTALLEIISELRFRGKPILLVLSDELVREPEAMLQTLCSAVGITFERAMLSWSPGPKPYDGCWAPYWYAGTHKSTGFSGAVRDTSSSSALPLHLRPLYHEASALFASMRALALRPTSTQIPRTPGQILTEQHKEDVIHQSGRLSDTGRVSVAGSGANAAVNAGAAPAATVAAATAVAAAAAAAKPVVCATGTHSHAHDERNADVLVGMRDGVTGNFDLVWRPAAKVSVLDSGFMLGDGMWEGLRLHRGVIMKVSEHFDRLWEGSKAVDMALGVTREELQDMVYRTVDANGMSTASGVHIRLMVTRGLKPTPYQSPYITIGQPTIVILPEYKEPLPGPLSQGITLFTCHVRRGSPDTQDPGWNSHSKLNCIAACIQAKKAGADEALMLDPAGFVCTCNSTNFFIVRKGEVWSATTKYLMPGITRATVLKLCAQNNIPARELDFSLTQVYGADEAFVTGTYAGVTPVSSVDGRTIGSDGTIGSVTLRLQQLLKATLEQEANTGRKAKP